MFSYGDRLVQAEEPMTGNGDKPGAGFEIAPGPFHISLKRSQMPQNGLGQVLGTVLASPPALALLWPPTAPQNTFPAKPYPTNAKVIACALFHLLTFVLLSL